MLRRLYDWTLEKSLHPHALWWLAAICFLESSVFPIPPHPLLGLMCLARPNKALTYGVVATVASVLGGLVGYAVGALLYDSVGAGLLSLLGLTDSFPRAACYLRSYGAEIILVKGATPIPFKLITITAGFINMDLWTFTWASVVSRGAMFLTVGVLFRLFGAPIKAFIDRYLGLVTAAFLVLLVGGFLIAGMVGGSGGGDAADACDTATLAGRTAPR